MGNVDAGVWRDVEARCFAPEEGGTRHPQVGNCGAPAGERGIHGVVLEEVAVPITLVGPLPAENQLHRGIDQECVYQGFKFDFAGLCVLQRYTDKEVMMT